MSGQPNLDPEQAMTMAKEEVLYRVDLFNSMVSGHKGARGWADAPRPHCSARAGVREGSSKQAAEGRRGGVWAIERASRRRVEGMGAQKCCTTRAWATAGHRGPAGGVAGGAAATAGGMQQHTHPN